MTAPDHAMKPLENILRERGHPYMDTIIEPLFRQLSPISSSKPGGRRRWDTLRPTKCRSFQHLRRLPRRLLLVLGKQRLELLPPGVNFGKRLRLVFVAELSCVRPDAYLARYTHRAAIANSRFVAISDDEIAFTYKDYRRNGRRTPSVSIASANISSRNGSASKTVSPPCWRPRASRSGHPYARGRRT